MNNHKNDESWKETLENLRDPELMKGIREGREDIKAGRLYSKEEAFGKTRKKHFALKMVEKNLK
ncbi:MAG: hypothetical protein AABZ07_06700 [Nitrospirota bacterium]